MSIVFKELFNLKISHNYFNDSVCYDFEIIPTQETIRKMARYKMRFIKQKEKCTAVIRMDNETSFVPITKDLKLSYALVLKNPSFYNYTDLPSRDPKKEIFLYDNEGVTKNLNLTTSRLRPSVFGFRLENDKDALTLSIKNKSGEVVFNELPIKDLDEFVVSADLNDQQDGTYEMELFDAGESVYNENFYLSNFLWGLRPLGLIEIVIKDDHDFSNARAYEIQFTYKSVQWIYHVTLNKDYTGYTINLKDSKQDDNDIESDYPTAVFKETTGVSSYEKGKTLVFKSVKQQGQDFIDETIPLLESPNKDLKLELSKDDKNIVIENLPNPSKDDIKPELYINV
jgi:hypothetical protein